MADTKNLIISDLSFYFSADSQPFFDHVSLKSNPGTITTIVGENGIGKSTLFRCIMHDVHPGEIIQGSITYDHEPAHMHAQYIRQDIAQIIAPGFTIAENIALAQLPRYPFLKRFSATISPQQQHLLRIFLKNISYDQVIDTLSGGQRQMLAICMNLQKNCRILLLDEPTAALDPDNARMVMDTIRMITTELSLITLIISHDASLAASYTDHQLSITKDARGTRIITEIA